MGGCSSSTNWEVGGSIPSCFLAPLVCMATILGQDANPNCFTMRLYRKSIGKSACAIG